MVVELVVPEHVEGSKPPQNRKNYTFLKFKGLPILRFQDNNKLDNKKLGGTMKKLKKLLAALGALTLLFSFVACDIPTESEILGNGDKTVINDPSTDTSDTQPSNENNNSDEDVSTSETIGTSWGSLFTNTGHNPIDLQVWQGFDAEFDSENGMTAEIIGSAWFGGAIVQSSGAKVAESIYYDMSSVKKMTFKVKASKNMTIWAGYSNQNKTDSLIKQNINVTTSWQTITVSGAGVQRAWAIFAFGSDGASNGDLLFFKDITYLDSNNNSVVLKYIK